MARRPNRSARRRFPHTPPPPEVHSSVYIGGRVGRRKSRRIFATRRRRRRRVGAHPLRTAVLHTHKQLHDDIHLCSIRTPTSAYRLSIICIHMYNTTYIMLHRNSCVLLFRLPDVACRRGRLYRRDASLPESILNTVRGICTPSTYRPPPPPPHPPTASHFLALYTLLLDDCEL